MAYFQTIYTCALFLAVIVCQETEFTEGRQLKPTTIQEHSSIKGQKDLGKHGGSTNYSHQKPTRKENNVQVPAVADVHSAGNSGARKKEALPRQVPNQSRAFQGSAKESVDDFRPTAPGSSPGVGHSFANHNVDSADNSGARKKETVLQQAPNQSRAFRDSAKESVDDFRPTAPGSSPGVGHSFADHYVDIQPEALGSSSGVHQKDAGNTHHFRTSIRGHNQGADHSLLNKHAKPNA